MTTYINPPSNCDTCQAEIEDEFFDVKTIHRGMWGNLCPKCYPVFAAETNPANLGIGIGQHYRKNEGGDFEKVLPKDEGK